MKVSIFSALILSVVITACNTGVKPKSDIPNDWIKIDLPNGWTLHAPKGFYLKTAQGIDSQPGYIISKQDSINLVFDSGSGQKKRAICDFKKQVEKASESREFYKEFFNRTSKKHKVYIDTVDNEPVVIVRPVISTKGSVLISISDCETGHWLGIEAGNLTSQKEDMVLKIYKTIEFNEE
jgi:hypothetical protein